jgi:hypothetical protein
MKTKNWLRNILFAVVALLSMHAVAETEQHDTVYFYNTWEQIIDQTPVALMVDPWIDPITPFEVIIESVDDDYNSLIWDTHIAATIGDSIWLVNSEYLQREFGGDAKKLNAFVPFFYNDKVAYVVYSSGLNWKNILFGHEEMDASEMDVDYYYIDFKNSKVLKVTHSVLSDLLEDYHDLQMRYEGMKDYKKRYMIEEYFFKFIDRATEDAMRPYILDLVK